MGHDLLAAAHLLVGADKGPLVLLVAQAERVERVERPRVAAGDGRVQEPEPHRLVPRARGVLVLLLEVHDAAD